METRHYHLELTDAERDVLREIVRTRDREPCAGCGSLAERLDRMTEEEDPLALAGSILRAWYYGRVKNVAREALGCILDGSIPDRDGLESWIDDSVDGTDIVIYTYKAKAALLASDNEDACEDQMGEPYSSPESGAWFAMRADVLECLHSLAEYGAGDEGPALPEGFDLQDESTWTAARDSAEEVTS